MKGHHMIEDYGSAQDDRQPASIDEVKQQTGEEYDKIPPPGWRDEIKRQEDRQKAEYESRRAEYHFDDPVWSLSGSGANLVHQPWIGLLACPDAMAAPECDEFISVPELHYPLRSMADDLCLWRIG
jgi:hypothetical protein